MTALEQRVYRTPDGRHVLDEDLHNADTDLGAVLAYAVGDDVPDDVIDELDGRVSPLEVEQAPVLVAAVPEPAPRGSRIRVWATEDGRHVREGDPAAALLVYTEEDDLPDDVLAELDQALPATAEEEAARLAAEEEAARVAAEEEAARVAAEEAAKAAAPAPNKAAKAAANK